MAESATAMRAPHCDPCQPARPATENQTMDFDLKITGGTIIDGTGKPGFAGDLAIKDGKIAAVGEVKGTAQNTIEAKGRVVAPGFVDIHTHYDAQLLWDRMMTISPWHGVTTVVMGNCGFSVAPTRPEHRGLIMRTLEKVEGMSLEALEGGLGYDWPFETFEQYLDTIERRGTAINCAAQIGHTALRMYVMGEEATERQATADEIAKMRAIVKNAINAGAIGFATSKAVTHVGYGGKPVPSRKAHLNEIKELIGALGEAGKGVVQTAVGRELFLSEMAEIARETGVPITWTALLAGATGSNDGHRRMLAQSEELARQGLAITPQVACRPLNFELTFKEPFIFEGMSSVFAPISAAPDVAAKIRIYQDPEFRAKFKAKAGSGADVKYHDRWERAWVSYCPNQPELDERNVAEIARERGVDPIDFVLDLSIANNLEARFRFAIFNYDEGEVLNLLQSPSTVIGLSDAGAHASQLCDACYSTYLLGHWVHERKAITLERAVWMLTARPAQVFNISDRGRLERGLAGDVVIFDPDKIGAGRLRRVRDLPAGADRLVSDASGIDSVIVNGTLIRREGQDTVDAAGALPGRLLRNGFARN
ncbi:MAG: amidohydrolase family protein [Candidatus Binataceae bacterium]|nr:amidohydrolase family protein [Candidatus Binataceae bacterium]